MTYLFTRSGMTALHAFVAKTTLFAFDLDGTLAPIVATPAEIIIPEDVRQALIQLDSMAPVAIITGRSRADAMKHLRFSPRYLVGNHGAEGLPGTGSGGLDFVRLCREWKDQLYVLLPYMSDQGISLDDKGHTLTLHYRKATDPSAAREEILAAIDRLQPAPRVVAGIYVKNLAPQSAPHKGAALETLMQHLRCRRAIFVGDDVTDEDVFHLANPAILGIRGGRSDDSQARLYLENQQEMLRLLQEVMTHLEKA